MQKSKNQLWKDAGKPGTYAEFSRKLDSEKMAPDFKNASGDLANAPDTTPQTWLDNNGSYRAFGTNEVVGYSDGKGGFIAVEQSQLNMENGSMNDMFPPREMTNKAGTVETIGKPAASTVDEQHPEMPLPGYFNRSNIFYGLMGLGIGIVITIAVKRYYGKN